MPYSRLKLQEAAEHLHIDMREFAELVKTRQVPSHAIGGQLFFYKHELNKWISGHLLSLGKDRLHTFHHRAAELQTLVDRHQCFLSDMVQPGCIAPELHARTVTSVLHELAAHALCTGLLSDEKQLFELLKEREAQGATALENGIALPHPAAHPPYLFIDSFVVIARVPAGVHFGSRDHRETDLFFLPCAHDDRQHVYMLARLALMLNGTTLADELREAAGAEGILAVFRRHETEVVARMAQAYHRTRRE
jgi:mannitol/fructose-specific phosphotransferase system IIA component (Ntr-type)